MEKLSSKIWRRAFTIAVCGVATILGLTLIGPVNSANAAGPQRFRNVHSGRCIDLTLSSTENGSGIQQWDCHGGDNQYWYDDNPNYGVRTFRSAVARADGTKVCIDGYRGHFRQVVIWTCGVGDPADQTWKIHYSPGGQDPYVFESKRWPGQCLDVRDASKANGAAIQLYDCHFGNNQKFR